MNQDRLGVILARCGSKGIPDKNIIDLCGKPLMAYSIIAATESGCFSRVMVSTDSIRYAEVARQFGVEVPFMRDADSASDRADKWDAVRDVLEKYRHMGLTFDDVCVLQPTSPLRKAEDIKKAYKIFDERKANAVVSVCECDHPPAWSGRLGEDGKMDDFNRPEMFMPRQIMDTYYRVNGAIFISRTDVVMKKTNIYEKNCYAYIMPRETSIDIDGEMDLKMAALIMSGTMA